ncbi:CPBP family intramembrane glutamic endopeptidase [Schleiferilactobacillus perolens]|jgi:membrane protease YdiL (CAAX protease family)|uniref:CPBP family intramembrane glutamic endopeptidase n=1 Tax=Schleiferilactobacillus perolens TaxID=100468 RepID=UPI0023527EBF|nr:type II CAAX endopeptidase family protein [Schleiferilactobacillus perolens]MCI2170845.1 CPBP family intramembrane metalloprotease [Schleiferilactobacillus perolens]
MSSYQVPNQNKLPKPHLEPPKKGWPTRLPDGVVRLLLIPLMIVLISVPQLPMGFVYAKYRSGQPLGDLPYYGLFALMILLYTLSILFVRWIIHRYTDQPLLRRWEARDWKFLGVGYLVMMAAKMIMVPLYTQMTGQQSTQNDAAIQKLLGSGSQMMWMIVFMTVIGAPILEEMVFRGYIMNAWYTRNPIWSVIISGALFAAVHQNNSFWGTLMYFVLGAVLAVTYRQTGNMGVNIGLHFLNNAPIIFVALNLIK